MKLHEAAEILGISLEEVTPDILKTTFKKLTMSFDAEKCKDATAKQKYMQITEAYKKLNSVMEGKDTFRAEDSHEIAAFMRMFMDMVGISENDPLPAAAMTFGMMFGANHPGMDEWSTDDDGDYDEEDEDGDYIGDYDDYPPPNSKGGTPPSLRNSAHNASRDAAQAGMTEDERKNRVAKKRADKRKKQKERKMKDTIVTMDEVMTGKNRSEGAKSSHEQPAASSRNMYAHKHHLKSEFFTFIQLGEVTTTEMVISTGFLKGFSLEVKEDVALDFKQELPSLYPVHKCITSFTDDVLRKEDNMDQLRDLANKRLVIAKQLLAMTDPVIDLHLYDEQGLSILHKSIFLRDNNFTSYIIELLTQPNPDRKTSLNINSRCHKKGWAPLHYAIEASNLDGMTMLSRAGANLAATSATDKKLTPLELARQRLKNSPQNSQLQQVIDHLQRLIADQKGGSGKKGESVGSNSASQPPESKSGGPEDGSVSTSSKATDKKSSAKKKQDTKKKGATQTPSKESTSNTNSASDKKDSVSSSGSGVQAAAKPSPTSASTSNSVNFLAGMSVASRDELVDRLLAMGFVEGDCLQAISRYGTDIDQAISWLCERPPSGASHVQPAPKDLPPAPAPAYKVTKATTKAEVKGSSQPTPAAHASAPEASKSDPEAAVRLQKEREELRRINRAWNARAEDEKRKLRQQQEEERLREMSVRPQSSPLNMGTISPSFGAGMDTTSGGGSFYSLGNSGKAMQQQMQQQQEANIPIAPTLHWPTVAQAAALNGKEAGAGSGASTPALVPPSPKLGSIGSAKSLGGSAVGSASSKLGNYSAIVQDKSATSSSMLGGQNSIATNDIPYQSPYMGSMGFGQAGAYAPMTFAPYSSSGYDSNYLSAMQQQQQQQQQQAYLGMMNRAAAPSSPSALNSEDSDGMETYRNGAIELSAGARPFVPKSFVPSSPAAAPLSAAPPAPMTPLPSVDASPFASSSAFGMSPSIGSVWGVSSVGVPPLGGSLLPPASTGLNLSAFSSPNTLPSGNPVGGYFDNLLSDSLALGGADHFDFDVAADIMPDLDSLLDHGEFS